MKKRISILLSVVVFGFSGCYNSNLDLDSYGVSNVSGDIKAEILDYKVNQKNEFIYELRNIQTQEEITAKSDIFYFDKGDIVSVWLNRGHIKNMDLVKRAKEINSSLDTSRKSKLKINKNISVPQSENINF